MPKFINDFKNKLIEHANTSGLNSNNIGMMGTPITVNPVIEHNEGDPPVPPEPSEPPVPSDPPVPLEPQKRVSTLYDDESNYPSNNNFNMADPKSPEGRAQNEFSDIIRNSTLSDDEQLKLSRTASTIRVKSDDGSFITLEPPSVEITGNSYFSIRVNLISSSYNSVLIATVSKPVTVDYVDSTIQQFVADKLNNFDLTQQQFVEKNPIKLNNFDPTKKIIWKQDDNNEIITSVSDLTYSFKAPDSPPESQNEIGTKIKCVYNGAIAEIILTVQPNQEPPVINSRILNDSLNEKFEDAIKNSKDSITASNTILNMLPSITGNQSESIIITLPNNLQNSFTNNPKYPNLSGSQEDIYLATTTIINGIETLDVSKLPSNNESFNLVVPSLLPGSNIDMLLPDGTTLKVYRDQSNKISFNGTDYMPIPASTIINGKQFTLIGIGSPVVFNVGTPPPPPPPPPSYNPSNPLEYIFYLANPVAFSGAIFYGFVSLVAIDPVSVILNRNWSVAFNIYIGLCAILSIFVWFKKQNPILSKTIFNQNVIAKHI
jgi:hypothetical protein